MSVQEARKLIEKEKLTPAFIHTWAVCLAFSNMGQNYIQELRVTPGKRITYGSIDSHLGDYIIGGLMEGYPEDRTGQRERDAERDWNAEVKSFEMDIKNKPQEAFAYWKDVHDWLLENAVEKSETYRAAHPEVDRAVPWGGE